MSRPQRGQRSPSPSQSQYPPPTTPFRGPTPGTSTGNLKATAVKECSVPGCTKDAIISDINVVYCTDHHRRYEMFVMGILPKGGAPLTESLFAMFDYLAEEIDKLRTELEMHRVRKKYLGDEDGNASSDSPDARYRYTRKSGRFSGHSKGLRKR